MKIEQVSELYLLIGKLRGISKVLEWSEEVDLKQVKLVLEEICTQLTEIAEDQRESLKKDDLNKKKEQSKEIVDPNKKGNEA